jgi:hypothetical protein
VQSGGTLIGSNVLLIVEHGSVHFDSGADIELDARRNGDYQGLLIYAPLDNHKVIALNGNYASYYSGTILAPSADIHLNGIDSATGFHSQIIGYYVEVDGTDNILIDYRDEQNYDAYRMPAVLLSQ